ncbi:MAG: alpha/beta fold hydrolase [Xanthobacteraceae bacterium]|nr:alpha/beta fold hydrolase [Xanthobacteraceae bacterium]
MEDARLPPLDSGALPAGIRSRFVENVNGLRMHVLEAGFESVDRPCLLLLHGFPELAYSWRKVMLPLAEAGYHVIAPDQRGYGRTTGCPAGYDDDLAPFQVLNLVADMVWLVAALGNRLVTCVIGHDYGSNVAASCALTRPDVFRSVIMMSAPFAPPIALPFAIANKNSSPLLTPGQDKIHRELARLSRPRKHYHLYYSTREANGDMANSAQGIHDFLRAYYHHKSADWPGNKPFPLQSWTAEELAKMPTYYVMDLDKDMAQTSAIEMPSASQIAACGWLTESELKFYSSEYQRTGFQGGLQWYRTRMNGSLRAGLSLFSGRTIDVPSLFIAGNSDWGAYQSPRSLEQMRDVACTRMAELHFIDGAGHWVQQEKPAELCNKVMDFLLTIARA